MGELFKFRPLLIIAVGTCCDCTDMLYSDSGSMIAAGITRLARSYSSLFWLGKIATGFCFSLMAERTAGTFFCILSNLAN